MENMFDRYSLILFEHILTGGFYGKLEGLTSTL